MVDEYIQWFIPCRGNLFSGIDYSIELNALTGNIFCKTEFCLPS
jgi:hypothetical protein